MPVKVIGNINGKKVNNTIRDGTNSKPYHLGIGVSDEEIIVILGSETHKILKGLDYGILGAPFIFLNSIIENRKEGTIVGEKIPLKVMNTLNRKNYIEAHYESSAGRKK